MNREDQMKMWQQAAQVNEAKKVNPWAVCHASTGPEKSKKFEKCVMDVKKSSGQEK